MNSLDLEVRFVQDGTYTMVVALDHGVSIEVGALGKVRFDAGTDAYTGSAFGPGGLARVDRHRELAAGERDARHWHVDYLLGHDAATISSVVTSPGSAVECAVARRLPEGPGVGFGASDCDCEDHLAAGVTRAAVERAHERARDAE